MTAQEPGMRPGRPFRSVGGRSDWISVCDGEKVIGNKGTGTVTGRIEAV